MKNLKGKIVRIIKKILGKEANRREERKASLAVKELLMTDEEMEKYF